MSDINTSRHHADWLSLVEVSGPFVSLPVLSRVFQHGLDPRDPGQAKVLRAAYEEWQDNPGGPGLQRAWILHVLTSLLRYPENQLMEGQSLPAGLEANLAEMGETLRPDFALVGHASSDAAKQAQLLIATYPVEQKLDRPVIGRHWKATPATRMMELLHGAGIPLGLITNGEHWMLVYAPRGETTGYASWFSSLWLDEPITLRAFHTLLGGYRFFSAATNNTLLAMLVESSQDQQEVTDQLGYQVREAVEVLVQSFDVLDKESNRQLLKGVPETALYEAALTIMMRLVFLFSAEERDLLHLGEPLYDNNYAVSTLQEQLQEVADRYGEEVLERRLDAWARLLATFRAVHGGIQHQDLMMQAYGGSLFDPDRYPFLEGRLASTTWRSESAEPLAVNNRVVLHLLNSLQRLRMKTGGAAETRRVSFRALGVEQIGHVYEGLLDHTAVRASEPILGIKGTRKKEAEIALSTMESLLAQGQDKLFEFLKDQTGRSTSALRRAMDDTSLLDEHKLLAACAGDSNLLARARPFSGLMRDDSFERPLVVLAGSIFVTAGTARRSSGTHYTPPTLTEPIVQYTLEPLVYEGPAEGRPRDQWKLKPPKEILSLKVCDLAMGSGAFLVQVCRYLAERLTEAWEYEEKKHPGEILITPDGKFSKGSPSERLVPGDVNERLAIARRVIADRCLYGVDINPMAVEMAKLSLWLITVDANRPFTFLDHAFKCGDSLLGITSLDQLENFSLRHGGGKQQAFSTLDLWRHIDEAKNKREALEAMSSDTPEQIAAKDALYSEAEKSVAKLKAVADVLVAVELKGLKGKAYDAERETAAEHMMAYWENGTDELIAYARKQIGIRRSFHWALNFPEVTASGGFDAFVGNPPFIGGQKITGIIGVDYRNYLVEHLAEGKKGSADLCAYFFLRAGRLLRLRGIAGLVATSTIAQGGTREVGLDQLGENGFSFPRTVSSHPWSGAATLEVAHVWLFKGSWNGDYILDGHLVPSITSQLSAPGRISGTPYRLVANADMSFIGSYVLGMGFVLTPIEAERLIAANPLNKNCLFPYLNGEELNSSYDQTASRWVINFHDWPLNRLGTGSWAVSDEMQRRDWLRNGIVPADYPGEVASDYPELLSIIEEKVRPERTRKNAKGEYQLRYPLFQKWWIYGEKRPALYSKLAEQNQAIITSLINNHLGFAVVPTNFVFAHKLCVFPSGKLENWAILQSTFHYWWAWKYSSTNLALLNYSPSDCYETFPFPESLSSLQTPAELCNQFRQTVMRSRQEGMTKTYNRYHNSAESSADILELRRLHMQLDRAVAAAYGWHDLELGHDFHETKQGSRFTISESARREALDRLLELNHKRHADEETERVAQVATIPATRGRKKPDSSAQLLMDL